MDVKIRRSHALLKFADVPQRYKFILAFEDIVDTPAGKSCLHDFFPHKDAKSFRVIVADEHGEICTEHGFLLGLSSRMLINETAENVLTELKEVNDFSKITVQRMAPRKENFRGTFKLVFSRREDFQRALQGVVLFCEKLKPGFWGKGAPELCYNCQLHGHVARNCHSEGQLLCGKCAGHTERCETERCVNCGGKHTAIDYRCKYARSVRDHDEARKSWIAAPSIARPVACNNASAPSVAAREPHVYAQPSAAHGFKEAKKSFQPSRSSASKPSHSSVVESESTPTVSPELELVAIVEGVVNAQMNKLYDRLWRDIRNRIDAQFGNVLSMLNDIQCDIRALSPLLDSLSSAAPAAVARKLADSTQQPPSGAQVPPSGARSVTLQGKIDRINVMAPMIQSLGPMLESLGKLNPTVQNGQ